MEHLELSILQKKSIKTCHLLSIYYLVLMKASQLCEN